MREKFHLKWRLKKHEQNHTKNSRAGYCHYYNNQKECPFVNAGCMFKHVKSGLCQNKNCTRPLCQFEHRDVTLEEVILDVDEARRKRLSRTMNILSYVLFNVICVGSTVHLKMKILTMSEKNM